MINNQVKNRERVFCFGEVNTSENEINSMLDLVKHETERIDSRFLEPACGDGNFLIHVLKRKLKILHKNYAKDQYEFEKNGIVLIGSIYGVDILEDNVISARKRLFDEIIKIYKNTFNKNLLNNDFINSIRFILEKNIIHGDSLNLMRVDNNPIIFSEWSILKNQLKRRDFALAELFVYSDFKEANLFSNLNKEVEIPPPVKTFPLVKFDRVFETC